jgi:signal transduction histidine kinase
VYHKAGAVTGGDVQRLEAIGRVVAAVAHDLSNLLLAIGHNLDRLVEEIPADAATKPLFGGAQQALAETQGLTRELLAFAGRQALAPTRFDPNEAVLEAVAALQGNLPAAIDLSTKLAADISPILADREQFVAALLALATNAGDAMPEGGRLVIETAGMVEAGGGARVLIAVTDTGSGMAPEIAARP